jgi:hypothetical protein
MTTTLRIFSSLLNRTENVERGEAGHPFMSPGWGGRLAYIIVVSILAKAAWSALGH